MRGNRPFGADGAESNLYISTKWDTPLSCQQLSIVVKGEGTGIHNNPALRNRARRKVISRSMVLSLIDVAKLNGDEDMIRSYWNSYYCQNSVIIANDRLYGNYCKNRFCTICCAIRKADLINKYYFTISHWDDPHFLTLTVKAQPNSNLKKWVGGMFRAFELIHNRCKKRHQRNGSTKLIGIKSLECEFNPIKRTYNPHFHLIVASKEIADLLKKEWLFQWTNKYTYHGAQFIRPITDLERDLIETIKYGSKIFTEPDLKKKAKLISDPVIYANALHNIFKVMKGRRIFERFGFNLSAAEYTSPPQFKFVSDYEEWSFPKNGNDWVNMETGECLTGYLQTKELNYLLESCIDLHLA